MPDDPKRFDDDLPPDSPDESFGGAAPSRAPWEEFAGQPPRPAGAGRPGAAPWDAFGAAAPPGHEDLGSAGAPWGSPQDAPGALEMPGWLSAVHETPPAASVPPMPGVDDWLSAFGQEAGAGLEMPAALPDDLSWLRAPEPPPGDETELSLSALEAQPFPDDAEVLPDWLSESAGEEAIPHDEGALPDWLFAEGPGEPSPSLPSADLGEEPPVEALPDWLAAAETPEPEPPRGVRRLPLADERRPDAGQVPDWAAADATPQERAPSAGMTYEEWEREQRALEAEAQKSPEERLLEEVPDWFARLDETPPLPPSPAAPAGEGPEFVPGWFLGLEERTEEEPDWLRRMDLSTGPLAEPVMPGAETPPVPSAPDVPDWFRGAPDADSIDWEALGARLGAPPAPEPPAPVTGEGELPDWLAGDLAGQDRILPPEDIPFPDLDLDRAALSPPGGEPEIEDFVERFELEEPDEVARRQAAPADTDVPDWLRELSASAESMPAERFLEGAEPGIPASDALDALDWLDELSPAGLQPAEELPVPPQATPAFVTEAALQAFDTAPLDSEALDALLGYDERPASAEPPAADDFGDEALRDLGTLFGETTVDYGTLDLRRLFDQDEMDRVLGDMLVPEEAPPPPLAPAPPAPAPAAQPAWVEELRPPEVPVTVKAGGAEASVRQRQIAELPERLRAFREESLRELSAVQASQAAGAGLLADIPGLLPAADMVIPAALGRRGAGQLVISPAQGRRVKRLQALLDLGASDEDEDAAEEGAARRAFAGLEPEMPALPARRARRPRRFKPDRLLVTLALLAALLAPFASDALHFAADPPPLEGQQAAVAAQVDALDAGDYVLFAFEYGPVSAGELDALAEAVLRDALARGAIPLTLSTSPAGAFHAGSVVAALGDDALLLAARDQGENALQAGEDYAALPYLSAEAVGVRSLTSVVWGKDGALERHPAFATNLRGDDSGLPISSLADDIALIVVVGDEATAIRIWAEQLAAVRVPKVALVTAAAEPLAAPYVGNAGYAGLLAGARDTVRYDAERNTATRAPYQMPADLPVELPDPPTARWHSMALGAAGAAGLIALGMIFNLLRALGRRRRR
jgi:hypothetical protein